MSVSVRQSVAIYLCAIAFSGGAPFFLLPVLTKHLTPLQFGEATSFLVWTALLANFAGLSANGFVSVRYFKHEAKQFRVLVSSSVATVGMVHLMALILVIVLFPLLRSSLGLSFCYAVLAVLAALLLNLNVQLLTIFQVSGQPWFYLHSRTLQAVIEFSLCIVFLLVLTPDANARVYSYSLALAASATLGLVYCLRLGYLGARIELGAVKGVLRFGLPMLPHIAAGAIIAYVDRLIVSSRLGTESLGIYMVSMQVGMAMVLLIEPLNKALTPWLFEHLNKGSGDVRRMIVKRTYLLFLGLVVVGLLFSYLADHLFYMIIASQFSAARPLVPWMIAGFVMQGMYYTQVNYFFFVERTGMLSIVTGSMAVIGSLISWGMVSAHGLRGAGMAFFINNTVLFLFVWLAASRIVPMPWRLSR